MTISNVRDLNRHKILILTFLQNLISSHFLLHVNEITYLLGQTRNILLIIMIIKHFMTHKNLRKKLSFLIKQRNNH